MKTLHIKTTGEEAVHGRQVEITDSEGKRIEAMVCKADIQLRPGQVNKVRLEVLSIFDLEVLPTECVVIDLCTQCAEQHVRPRK